MRACGRDSKLCVLTAVVAALLIAPTTAVAQNHPTGYAAVFADCPLSNPAVTLCVVANITGGELVLGKRTVPINERITLQGGLIPNRPESREYTFAGAEDGDALSHTPLRLPGGLAGVGRVTRTTEATVIPELAGPSSAVELNFVALAQQTGVGLRLPIRARINSPTLGGSCYVGSASQPVLLDLTAGTTDPLAPNRPIKGQLGELSNAEEEGGYPFLKLTDTALVGNTFAVPGATGCNGPLYSAILDSDVGLPSAASHNTAILIGKLEFGTPEAVMASE